MVADVPSPGTDQETVYTYGTPKGGSAGQSKIATGNLLFKVTYPGLDERHGPRPARLRRPGTRDLAQGPGFARDIDNDSTDEYTLSYDAVGDLTDDGEEYTYTWDAFGRLREIKNGSTTDFVQELRYNGLGFLIGEHYDANEDGDVDGSDPYGPSPWEFIWVYAPGIGFVPPQ